MKKHVTHWVINGKDVTWPPLRAMYSGKLLREVGFVLVRKSLAGTGGVYL